MYIDPSVQNRELKCARFPFPTIDEPASLYLSVVVPAYNEFLRLPSMLKETLEYLAERRARDPTFTYEVIIVDDGSVDATADVALKAVQVYSANVVRVLRLSENQGKGGAVQQGMLHARGSLLLFTDADGASQISCLERLERNLRNKEINGFCVAVGSRAHLQDNAVAQRKWYRNILTYGFHFVVAVLGGVRDIKDTQCGFKLFTRKTAQLLFTNQRVRRWCFDVELLSIAQARNIPIVEVAINWTEVAGSKLQIVDASFQMARDIAIIRLSYALGIWKIVDPDDLVLVESRSMKLLVDGGDASRRAGHVSIPATLFSPAGTTSSTTSSSAATSGKRTPPRSRVARAY